MNLKLIKNAENVEDSILLGNDKILVKEYFDSKYPGIRQAKYYIYNLTTNEKYEILPKFFKLDIFRIVDAGKRKEYVYFVQYNNHDGVFNFVRYDYKTKKILVLYTIHEDIKKFYTDKKLSIFVLDESNIIVQTEKLRRNLSDNYEGYFDFELMLYMSKEGKSYTVVDENFVNNGISDMIPVSDNLLAIKTGFSLLEDDRYQILDKFEVSVESVSLVNTKQLISDLIINQNSIIMDNIDQAYYKQTIPYISASGDYLIYSKIDNETREESIFFYNTVNKTVLTCINKDITNAKKLAQPLVIHNKPYIRVNKSKKTEFLNLKNKKIELSFASDKIINDICGDIFIITEQKKGLFGNIKNYICVYKYPTMAILHSEKGEYRYSLYDGDSLYIFEK